jgi:probable F420-dependent oxidoreductase
MKVGVQSAFSQHTAPEFIATVGKTAEERGFYSLWVPEHVLFFRDYSSRYPYSKDGRIPGDPDGVLEPFTALTYLAAHTERIRLGTGICLVPQRNPVYLAKQVADVDFLSGGRVDFGVGVGWLREEFEALGVPWERRADRTRDYLAVMRTLWCDEVSSYRGEFYTLPECLQNPKPVQKPHPPIFFGGESKPALRRVAELGHGWFGYNVRPDVLEDLLSQLDALLADAGRSRRDIEIYVTPAMRRPDPEALERYRELGVDQVIFPLLARSTDQLLSRADALAEQTLGH